MPYKKRKSLCGSGTVARIRLNFFHLDPVCGRVTGDKWALAEHRLSTEAPILVVWFGPLLLLTAHTWLILLLHNLHTQGWSTNKGKVFRQLVFYNTNKASIIMTSYKEFDFQRLFQYLLQYVKVKYRFMTQLASFQVFVSGNFDWSASHFQETLFWVDAFAGSEQDHTNYLSTQDIQLILHLFHSSLGTTNRYFDDFKMASSTWARKTQAWMSNCYFRKVVGVDDAKYFVMNILSLRLP